MPIQLRGHNSRGRIRTCISRAPCEVTVVFTTGRNLLCTNEACPERSQRTPVPTYTRRGTFEKSRLEARYLQVPSTSGLRPRPRSSNPWQGPPSLRVVMVRSISSLSPPAKLVATRTLLSASHEQKQVREQAVTAGLAPMRIRTSQPEGCFTVEVSVTNHH